jgi:outer membrane protein OmpA-like peptidoglycan-associated protein
MARYQWNAAEKAGWMTNMESTVEAAWGGKHQFHINKPQHEWIGARIAVDVQTHEGARAGNDHIAVDAIKMPPGESLGSHNDAAVHNVTNPDGTVTDTGPESGSAFVNNQDAANSFDGQMMVSSNDFAPRHDNLLRNSVNFDHNSADVDAATRSRLTSWVATFQGAPGTAGSRSIALKLEAHTSASGTVNYNRDLAQRRANSVQAELTTLGFTNVTGAVITDPQGEVPGSSTTDSADDQRRQRRVDLIVDSGGAQVVGAHEIRHRIRELDSGYGGGSRYGCQPRWFDQRHDRCFRQPIAWCSS